MFRTILTFELRYHLRRPSTYLFFAALFVLTIVFLSARGSGLAGAGGRLSLNAPYVLAKAMATLTAVAQMVTAALVGLAAVRDIRYGTHELLFTTPIAKGQYLGARFLGVFVIGLVIYAAIPLGALAISMVPWVDTSALLPISAVSYASPFLLFVVPNLFVCAALFFAVGALTRNELAIYTQGIVLLVAWSVSAALIAQPHGGLDRAHLAALVDVFGIHTFDYYTRYWTPAEKNSRLVTLAGTLLENRLIWVGIAIAALAATYRFFRVDVQPRRMWRGRKVASLIPSNRASPTPHELTHPSRARSSVEDSAPLASSFEFGARERIRQLASLARFSFLRIVRDKPFLAIAAAGVVNASTNAWYTGRWYDTPIYPITSQVASGILTGFQAYFVIIAAIYAGELAWRERQLGASQIVDALPVSSSVSMTGKLLGLFLAEAVVLLVLMLSGIAVQIAKGYYHFEPGLYVRFLFGVQFPAVVAVTLLAFFIHSVVNHKSVGHLLLVIYYVGTQSLFALGFEHQLWAYGHWAPFTYSEMNGFGHFAPDLVWLSLCWIFVGLWLATVAYLFWVRGTDTRWSVRLRKARARLDVRARAAGGLTAAGALFCGGFIFYNTNVLNTYQSSTQRKALAASYENAYRRYAPLPQPWLVGVRVRADLFPERRALALAGVQTYVNRDTRVIDTLFVSVDKTLSVDSLVWSRPAVRLVTDSTQGVYLYRLPQALAPGDTLRLAYGVRYQARGFPNSEPNNAIVANGTFLNPDEWSYVPLLGYRPTNELTDAGDRKKFGLPRRERSKAVADHDALHFMFDNAPEGWVTFDAVVSTAPDQIAVAPGQLVRQWTERGRRLFHYREDEPMLPAAGFLSARYAVRSDSWRAPDGAVIPIQIFYHPAHTYNLDRLIAAVQHSLAYYTASFGPYQFSQFRMVEVPAYHGFAAASAPNTIAYSEWPGFVMRVSDDDGDLDMPFFVTAHEVAHQWWAHQVAGADVQGRTMLSESLAEYSALMVMEHQYGRDESRKFLRHELDRYLAGRSSERERELPLMRVESGQSYIHYDKGSLAFYALRDYIGEDRLNAVLRSFVARHRFNGPPFPTAQELVSELRAATPDSLQHVITDLFETITLWDLQASEATATHRADGKYDVRLVVAARKLRADSLGNESAIPVDDYVDVGVFGARMPGNSLGRPLYLEKIHLTHPQTVVNLVVDALPERAGIDPYNKLIDRAPEDNVMSVTDKQ